ncbi:phosphatidylinositide phosphatase sac1-like [Stylonychia lemnae]|uniref:Phosphatidylinositide phosphatase sac1-like n=1 Tax=Stylonychia lemnae TaxID=5949 RepID=A0A078B2K9_STYLE|nr:phosphatidylinositide phosphatase sac1-like [Stylonychia lemnae]|eukprot:CDW87718.1 phosphatidylinositide phosphatase sac1-like [Stylonychia lemnae]
MVLVNIKQMTDQREIYGVFGIKEISDTLYLMLIEECTLMGQVNNSNIFRIEKLLYIPISRSQSNQISRQARPFIQMIDKIVAEKAFYFSYDMDLTKSIQQNVKSFIKNTKQSDLEKLKSLYPNVIEYQHKYAFNDHLFNEIPSNDYAPFIVPCIYGFVYIKPVQLESTKLILTLISRKDCRRPGRRFISRGIDENGNVSNYVETEHLITYYDQQKLRVASFVQTRGSIPLIWSQKPTMKYSPAVKVNQNIDDSLKYARIHVNEQKDSFGDQVFVNLIDKKGTQLRIGQQFTRLIDNLGDQQVDYTWFDFHHECRNMKYENLAKLLNIIQDKVDNFGYFQAVLNFGFDKRDKIDQNSVTIMNTQRGAVRTNCMDCLDRTNVFQSVLSRQVLHKQIWKQESAATNVLNIQPFEKFYPSLEDSFREAWTNNADALSILYSGTPALKTDFTRTGKRTLKGALNDGKNSVKRYYINNFCLIFLRIFMKSYFPIEDRNFKQMIFHGIVYLFSFFADDVYKFKQAMVKDLLMSLQDNFDIKSDQMMLLHWCEYEEKIDSQKKIEK